MSEPLFHLSGIHFAYDPGQPVLAGVHFTLHAGDRVALTGTNGAGKTTLFYLMVGLLKAQAGRVEAFGRRRIHEKDFVDVRPRAGLLFQDPDDQLFCPTVIEDVAFGPLNLGKSMAETRIIVRHTLARLGLEGFENRITHQLSGGQRRLVALAPGLAMNPEVLLLDEPANALDAGTRERLITILDGLPQAMIVISHDEDFLTRIARRRVCLAQGRLVEY